MSAVRELSRRMKRERLDFIRSMLREVREMAEGDGDAFLAYLIEMAYIEASDRLRKMEMPQVGEQAGVAA